MVQEWEAKCCRLENDISDIQRSRELEASQRLEETGELHRQRKELNRCHEVIRVRLFSEMMQPSA